MSFASRSTACLSRSIAGRPSLTAIRVGSSRLDVGRAVKSDLSTAPKTFSRLAVLEDEHVRTNAAAPSALEASMQSESPGAWTNSEQEPLGADMYKHIPQSQGANGKLLQYVPPGVPEDVIKEFEMKLEGDLKSVGATLVAGIGVITWWRGVWALLDHYIEDSVFGHLMCVSLGLMIILYIRVAGYKLTNFFPPS